MLLPPRSRQQQLQEVEAQTQTTDSHKFHVHDHGHSSEGSGPYSVQKQRKMLDLKRDSVPPTSHARVDRESLK